MKISTKEMALISMFTGLTAIGGLISIPVGDVPISLQSLFVIISGLILGPKLGAFSQIVYIILGLSGAPVFANFTGGLQTIMKPSFGFIVGFVFAAYIVGKIANPEKGMDSKKIWVASITGTIVIYLFGLPYMHYILNIVMTKGISLASIIKMGCLVFLPGDILKAIISAVVATQILPILNKSGVYN